MADIGERLVADGLIKRGDLEPSAIGPTPGIVKSEADTILDTLHAQVDFAEGYQRRVFEGEQVAAGELRRRERELVELASAVNKRLADVGVRLIGAWPEVKGLGARFKAIDAEGRDYEIDLKLPDEERVAGMPFSSILGGLETVRLMESAIREKRAAYLESERFARLGLVRPA